MASVSKPNQNWSTIERIGAVVVTYYPDKDALYSLLRSLSNQTYAICLVDNTPGSTQDWHNEFSTIPRLTPIVLGENTGIAYAQNRGIEHMINQGCDAVAIFDQDSVIDSNYIAQTVSEASCASHLISRPIAAVGPNYKNENGAPMSPFVEVSFGHLTRIQRQHPEERFCVPACLISSGSILLTHAIKTIGLMNEELFIDYVDTEWCLRAQQHGFVCLGLWNILMTHTIGDRSVRVLGRRISLHSPLRHYYLVRNATYLYLYSDLPFRWKFSDGIHLLAKFALYSLIDLPRFDHCRSMLRGFLDGVARKMGARM